MRRRAQRGRSIYPLCTARVTAYAVARRTRRRPRLFSPPSAPRYVETTPTRRERAAMAELRRMRDGAQVAAAQKRVQAAGGAATAEACVHALRPCPMRRRRRSARGRKQAIHARRDAQYGAQLPPVRRRESARRATPPRLRHLRLMLARRAATFAMRKCCCPVPRHSLFTIR